MVMLLYLVAHMVGQARVDFIMHKVVTPNMIRPQGTQPIAGGFIEPEPPALRLLPGDLESFLTPYSFHPLVVDPEALPAQEGMDASVSVAPVVASELDNTFSAPQVGGALLWPSSLCRAVLADTATRSAL